MELPNYINTCRIFLKIKKSDVPGLRTESALIRMVDNCLIYRKILQNARIILTLNSELLTWLVSI